ncbi:MAG: hypothetical protein U0228_28850 [Myxococcaceae bacterium]
MKLTVALIALAQVAQLSRPVPDKVAPKDETPKVEQPAAKSSKPMFTTYFYTAGEAIVHGYEPDTKVRIVSLSKKGTIWEGVVQPGDTHIVSTGQGVFGFIADKKATILVGTPSSCTVVGYFLKDQNGSFKSDHFYAQLPTGAGGEQHFTIFAYEPGNVSVYVKGQKEPFKSAELKGGDFLDFTGPELGRLAGQTVEIKAGHGGVTAEVYYDEGFMVPADNGRGSGKRFLTYVGTITERVNDLNLIAQGHDAKVKVRDLKTNKTIFEGVVERGTIHSETLSGVFAEVTSDFPINVVVAGYKHYQAGYAEHHFQTGLEGSGIENDFLVTTSGELWLFSYFTDNEITVTDARDGKAIFKGTLNAGAVRGLQPGFGLFKVKGSKGLSVMGGASSCGADYSPAGSMFAVDEALFEVIAQVKEERVREAAAQGRTLTSEELNAPLSDKEWKKNASKLAPAAARPMTLDEVNERKAEMQQ